MHFLESFFSRSPLSIETTSKESRKDAVYGRSVQKTGFSNAPNCECIRELYNNSCINCMQHCIIRIFLPIQPAIAD